MDSATVILNITCVLDPQMVEDWKTYVLQELIPDHVDRESYEVVNIFRIIATEVQPPSYCVQFVFTSLTDLGKFQKGALLTFESMMGARYGETCHTFKTVLQSIN